MHENYKNRKKRKAGHCPASSLSVHPSGLFMFQGLQYFRLVIFGGPLFKSLAIVFNVKNVKFISFKYGPAHLLYAVQFAADSNATPAPREDTNIGYQCFCLPVKVSGQLLAHGVLEFFVSFQLNNFLLSIRFVQGSMPFGNPIEFQDHLR